jgi:PAS domain S-box-containing protein
MPGDSDRRSPFTSLREKAEAIVSAGHSVSDKDSHDILELLHELDIHQAELEIQNEELLASQRRLSELSQQHLDLFENAPCGYLILSSTGMIVRANIAATRLLSPEGDVPPSDGLSRYIEKGHEGAHWAALRAAGETGERQSVEIPLKRPEGPPHWVRAAIEARRADGQVHEWLVALTDINERKISEFMLRESEKRHREFYENSPQPYQTLDRNARLIDVNPAWLNTLGYSRGDVAGQKYATFLDPESAERFEADFAAFLESGIMHGVSQKLRHKSGRYLEALFEGRIGRWPDGTFRQAYCVFQDITELKRTELALRDALSEIERLRERLEAENVYLREEVRASTQAGDLVGSTPAMKTVMAQAERVAATGSTVLITGETGTGKELLARAIHGMSDRRDRPLIVVNCAALPETLIESELFGREKGAYTDATTSQPGRFEIADGSTIFLDEISELPAGAQAKLLRVLEQGQLERLGSTRTIDVDVRVIVATNCDLEQAMSEGRFRQDLFYRLNVFPIHIPPLRERSQDIPALVRAFVDEISPRMAKSFETVSRGCLGALVAYSWPGNVRELRNLVERAMIKCAGPELCIEVPSPSHESIQYPSGPLRLEDVEREHILKVLKDSDWRVRGRGGAAERLGLKPSTLESRMKKLGIERPK